MNSNVLLGCELLAKEGYIKLVAGLISEEVKSRLLPFADSEIDVSELIVSTYDPTNDIKIDDYISYLVNLLNTPGVKAK